MLVVAGCGSNGPHLQRSAAAPLIALADRIPREGACAQARDIRALKRQLVSLVNAGRVPASLQESLFSGVNALVVQTPPCLPAVPADTAPTVTIPEHGKHKGNDKHGGGDGGGD